MSPMQGLGFFQAATADDGRWDELSAGLVVFNCCAAAFGPGITPQEIRMARETAGRVPNIPARRRLIDIIDLVDPRTRAPDGWKEGLGRRLFAYGLDLHSEGHLGAAVDLFSMLAERLEDNELRLGALQRKGYACRILGQFDEAEAAYDLLMFEARGRRSTRMQIAAKLGHAKVAIERGNMPKAVDLVGKAVTHARRAKDREMIGNALIDRAAVAGMRHDPVSAIIDTNEAIGYLTSESARERSLVNMGWAFREVEHTSAAILLADRVSEEGKTVDVRQSAAILRYNLAIDARDQYTSARLRHLLLASTITPLIAIEYYQAASREHARSGRWKEAEQAARQMLETAESEGRTKFIFDAESAIIDIRREREPAVYAFRPTETTIAAKRTLAAIEESLRETFDAADQPGSVQTKFPSLVI